LLYFVIATIDKESCRCLCAFSCAASPPLPLAVKPDIPAVAVAVHANVVSLIIEVKSY
jgi:hypothetical protein